jgi:hypothetical protein
MSCFVYPAICGSLTPVKARLVRDNNQWGDEQNLLIKVSLYLNKRLIKKAQTL